MIIIFKEKKMGRNNAMESLSILLRMIKLMSKENGITITELAKELEMDRWSVRYMIDDLETFNSNGTTLFIQEFKDPNDKRKTFYKVDPKNLWTMKIPAFNLSDEEGILLALLLQESEQIPLFSSVSKSLQEKMRCMENRRGRMIFSTATIDRVYPPFATEAAKIILKAIDEDKCIAFDYSNAGDSRFGRREVMPLYLFIYDNIIYLNAQKLEEGALRTYAIDRMINKPEIIDIPKKKRPKKLEYDGRLEDPFGPFWNSEEFEFTVEFDSWQGWYIMHQSWPSDFKIEKLENGNVLFTAKARWRYGVAEWINKQISHVISVTPENIIEK